MLTAEIIIPLIIEAVCGAAGGAAVGRWSRRAVLGTGGNALVGAVGGLVLTWLAARIPGVGRFVGGVGSALDSAVQGTGGLTLTILVCVGIAGLLGGILSVLLFGAMRGKAGE